MKQDKATNPIFWAFTDRKDWLFGHDARKLEISKASSFPELAGLPAKEARIYDGAIPDTELRKKFRSMRHHYGKLNGHL